MEPYTTIQTFADTWGLLAMAAFFVGAIAFTFRPGNRQAANDAANIPLKDD